MLDDASAHGLSALAELNRRPAMRPGGLTRLNALRETPDIERYADLVGLLLRPEYNADADDNRRQLSGETALIIAKHRNGPVGGCG